MITKIGSREFLFVLRFLVPIDQIVDFDFTPVGDIHCRIKTYDAVYSLTEIPAAQLSAWLDKRTK